MLFIDCDALSQSSYYKFFITLCQSNLQQSKNLEFRDIKLFNQIWLVNRKNAET